MSLNGLMIHIISNRLSDGAGFMVPILWLIWSFRFDVLRQFPSRAKGGFAIQTFEAVPPNTNLTCRSYYLAASYPKEGFFKFGILPLLPDRLRDWINSKAEQGAAIEGCDVFF